MPLNFNKAEFVRSAGEPKDFLPSSPLRAAPTWENPR